MKKSIKRFMFCFLWVCMVSAICPSAAQAATIFNNFNVSGVYNGPSSPTQFSVSGAMKITTILTYHWNNGSGSPCGTISIKHSDGTVYGPWTATTVTGGGNNWYVYPQTVIKAGTYTIVDSGNATWSYNSGSGNAGFAQVYGEPSTSTTQPPTATTSAASSVTATSATLNGTVNPNGDSTTWYFDYGTTTGYGSKTTEQSAGSGTSSTSVTANLTGLTANTAYHFRIVATNSAGTTNGSDQTFKTATSDAQAATIFNNFNVSGVYNGPSSPTQFSVSGAMMITTILTYHWNNGSGSPCGTISIKHSDGTVYGPWTATTVTGGGNNWYVYPQTVIKAGTYTIVDSGNATWSYNSGSGNAGFAQVYGEPSTSTTQPPTATTSAASSVTATSATLNGTVNPNGAATTCYFEYGTTTSYGSKTATQNPDSGTISAAVTASITGLTANTTYHFRVVATNSAGTTNGSDQTFKTAATSDSSGLNPPDGISSVDETSNPNNAPIYMGNIVNSSLSGKMELKATFPAYNKSVDIWILIALPDGRFYTADESGKLLLFESNELAPIALGVSGKKTEKTILTPFEVGAAGTSFDPWPKDGTWTVYWLIAPDSNGDIMEAIDNGDYELGFYVFDVNNNGTPSSGGEITGPGGSVIHLPTGNSSDVKNISLINGDSTWLINEFQNAVSDVYKISIADATSVTGNAGYTIDIPLTSQVSDPDKLALSVKLTSGTVVPILGEYDQSSNAYKINVNGLFSGWNMQVVEEPEARIINGPEAGTKNARRHKPRWATTKKWSPCDAWAFRLSAPTAPNEAIFDTELKSLKSAAEDLCQKYSAMGFREPQMWISSRYGGRVVNIVYKVEWGSYYISSGIKDTPPMDEIELNNLGQIFIDYFQWNHDLFPNYVWSIESIFAHELFHGVQWGYDIKFGSYSMNNNDYIGIQSLTEGTATAMGMTYQKEGKFTGPDVWVRNDEPKPDILNLYGTIAPFDGFGYPKQDFFAYVAKKYGKNSFAYLVDLFEELANQNKVIASAKSSEDESAAYRKAMDISFNRSFGVGLADVFKTYALDRAYHLTAAGNLRSTDIALPNNTLRADLFKGGIPSSAYSKDKPFKKEGVWPLTAAPFRIPAIPATSKTSGKLPMVFSVADGTIDELRIVVVPEVGGVAQTGQIFEVTKLDTPVDIPVAGADSVSVLIVGLIIEKHTPVKYPAVTAYINEVVIAPDTGPVGTAVTITSTGFGTTQGTVTFNGTAATVSSWSDTKITTTVPTGATTGNVVVTTSKGVKSDGGLFTVTDENHDTSLSISISPSSITIPAYDKQQFTITLVGTTRTDVSWSIMPGVIWPYGSVSKDGILTAPSIPGTYELTGTVYSDDRNNYSSASVTVNVISNPIVGIWSSSWGDTVTLVMNKGTLTGTWSLGGQIGQLTDCSFDTDTKILRFYYHHPTKNQEGWQKFLLYDQDHLDGIADSEGSYGNWYLYGRQVVPAMHY